MPLIHMLEMGQNRLRKNRGAVYYLPNSGNWPAPGKRLWFNIMTNTGCSESKICCTIRCLDTAAVEAAKHRLDPAGMQKVPYTCQISGKEEELLLVGNRLASRLSGAIPEAEDADGARILAGLYATELCECDVATLTGLPEHEVIRRLRTYSERGLLAHRTLHDMNYFRLVSGKVRRAIADAVAAFKGLG